MPGCLSVSNERVIFGGGSEVLDPDEADVTVHERGVVPAVAVSTDKGCYLGQETVAKVASGRGAARAPMLLEVIDGDTNGDDLVGRGFATDRAKRSGTVLSSACWQDGVFLQASVARELRV